MDGMLSQEEINALLSGMSGNSSSTSSDNGVEQISNEEKDAIGEISNISMGTAATTLSTLVNRKVTITTPTVSLATWEKVSSGFDKPCVFIQINYKEGLSGNNILIIQQRDSQVITDLMMGGDGTNVDGEFSEFHLSAICEAMNQMMGSSSTSLSSMLETIVDISPPVAKLIEKNQPLNDMFPLVSEPFVKVSFRMEIQGVVDSEIMQLYNVDFARDLYKQFIKDEAALATASMPQAASVKQTEMNQIPINMGGNQNMMNNSGNLSYAQMPEQEVNVSAAQFQPFRSTLNPVLQQENIGLIMDVPLEVTVELGRTHKSIKEILEFAPGTIIELNKLAGEPVDVLVNGKYVAKGEVVVIEESFGIRVTEIIK